MLLYWQTMWLFFISFTSSWLYDSILTFFFIFFFCSSNLLKFWLCGWSRHLSFRHWFFNFFKGFSLICWCSNHQDIVPHNSTKVKRSAMINTFMELKWLYVAWYVIWVFLFCLTSIPLHCDNTNVLMLIIMWFVKNIYS